MPARCRLCLSAAPRAPRPALQSTKIDDKRETMTQQNVGERNSCTLPPAWPPMAACCPAGFFGTPLQGQLPHKVREFTCRVIWGMVAFSAQPRARHREDRHPWFKDDRFKVLFETWLGVTCMQDGLHFRRQKMHLRLISSLVFLSASGIFVAAEEPAPPLQGGSYEITYRLELPHVERWAIDKTTTVCLS